MSAFKSIDPVLECENDNGNPDQSGRILDSVAPAGRFK